jgi:hypothetical protein
MLSRMFGNAARVLRMRGRRAPRGTFRPQTLLFDKSRYSFMEAIQWARKHGYSTKKVTTEGSHIRIRQHEPAACVPGTFRTVSFGRGIKAIFCELRTAQTRTIRRAA